MTHMFTEEELRPATVKTNMPTLISEIISEQSEVDEQSVKKLSRDLLVLFTIAIRKFANQNAAVETALKDFKLEPDLVDKVKKYLEESMVTEAAQSESVKMMLTW